MSISRLAIREAIAEETGLGVVLVPTVIGTTTTVLAPGDVGPLSSQRFPRGSPMLFTTLGGHTGGVEVSFVTTFDPVTGTVTFSPGTSELVAVSDRVEIWSPALSKVERVNEAIDRALDRHCKHWVPIPVTLVPDGDCGDSGVTLWGTASNCTATKVNMPWPSTIGQRYLFVNNSAANGYQPSAAMACQAGDVWRIDVTVYLATAGTASLVVYDNTNAAAISLNGDGGSYTGTGWKRLANTVTIPPGCETITVRLGAAGAADDTYWTSVIAHPLKQHRFPLPARCTEKRLARLLVRHGEEVEDFRFREYGWGWQKDATGVGVAVQLPDPASATNPPYIEELRGYEALATDAATTDCPDELAVKASIYQVYKPLARGKSSIETKSGYMAPSDIKLAMLDALRDMKGVQHLSADDRTVW